MKYIRAVDFTAVRPWGALPIAKIGAIFFAGIGTEHFAHPQGEARILVIERDGSV
jgi:hypothetical protein